MAKEKVCKKCKLIVKSNECPICKGNQFSTVWQGRINFVDVNKSSIAKKMDIKMKGSYAIKVR